MQVFLKFVKMTILIKNTCKNVRIFILVWYSINTRKITLLKIYNYVTTD